MNIDLGLFEKYNNLHKALLNSLNNYYERIKSSRVDKYDLGFNLDNRFSHGSMKVSLNSWTGVYGDSGCSRAINLGNQEELFYNLLTQYLNDNKKEILQWIIDRAKQEADKASGKAIEALEKTLADLKEATNNGSTTI